jgi:hypothetical protein
MDMKTYTRSIGEEKRLKNAGYAMINRKKRDAAIPISFLFLSALFSFETQLFLSFFTG